MQKQEVAGYTITERLAVGDTLIVLGENGRAPSPYVTWHGSTKADGFEWGHYFTSKGKAVEDLYLRAAAAAKHLGAAERTRGKEDGRGR
jgi:hypothetical protein